MIATRRALNICLLDDLYLTQCMQWVEVVNDKVASIKFLCNVASLLEIISSQAHNEQLLCSFLHEIKCSAHNNIIIIYIMS